MSIFCQNCGLCDDYEKRQAGPHVSAYCNGCGKYIKHLPQGKPVMLHFGKYKGRELSSMLDDESIRYLRWLASEGDIKESLRESIVNHINANAI